MQRLLATVTLMTLLPLTAPAQAPDTAPAERFIETARTRLDLSDEQLDQVSPLLRNSAETQRRILASYGIDPETRAEIRERIRERR